MHKKIVGKDSVYLLTAWTLFIIISISWNVFQNHKDTIDKALLEARTYFELNLSYRKWNAMLGGVYAPVDRVKPNPYLNVPDRDIMTTNKKTLTLVNPAYMTRLVFDIVKTRSELPVNSKLTSLKTLNPANNPDEWEKEALLALERGEGEVTGVQIINEMPYLRFIRPFTTEESCLKCHGHQAYKVGDIRGGISFSVPLKPYYESEAKTRNIIILTHILLWLIGCAGTIVFFKKSRRQEELIAESEWKFRTLSEFSSDWDYWKTGDNNIVFMSPSCKEMTGYTPEEFISNPDLVSDIIYPDDRPIWLEHLKGFKTRQKDRMEFRIITKSGQIKWLSHVCGPIYARDEFLGRRTSNRDITEQKKAGDEREKLILELRDALEKIRTLKGLIPICASCKKIRDDRGFWNQLEAYISEHSEAEFSHSICPSCAKRLYPDFYRGEK